VGLVVEVNPHRPHRPRLEVEVNMEVNMKEGILLLRRAEVGNSIMVGVNMVADIPLRRRAEVGNMAVSHPLVVRETNIVSSMNSARNSSINNNISRSTRSSTNNGRNNNNNNNNQDGDRVAVKGRRVLVSMALREGAEVRESRGSTAGVVNIKVEEDMGKVIMVADGARGVMVVNTKTILRRGKRRNKSGCSLK